jgi:hypothetical protein
MSQWGSKDQSNNAPVWAPARFNKAPNTANRDALYGNGSADAFITGKTVGVFAAGANEVSYGHSNVYGVTSVTVTAPGTGFQVVPTISFANAAGDTTGANAAATATAKVIGATINTSAMGSGGAYIPGEPLTITGGTGTAAVVTVANTAIRAAPAVTVAGSGYANGDTISFADGVGTQAVFTVTTGAANTGVASLALTSNGSYTTNPTLVNGATVNVTGAGTGCRITANTRVKNVTLVTSGEYSALPSTNAAPHATANGSGAQTVLTFGLSHVQVTNAGAGYTKAPTVTVGGTGGSGATANANIQPVGGDAAGVCHTGWQLVTLGSGARAGRVQVETLVAGGITTDNANDNPVFPN